MMLADDKPSLPKTVSCESGSIDLRRFERRDIGAMQVFAGRLPEQDLLFLNRDINQRKVLDAWATAIDCGEIHSLIAERGGEVVGTCAVVLDPLSRSAHVGEVRLLVAEAERGRGVGRALLAESIAIAIDLGLEKLSARMLPDQSGAIALFEALGFRREALLAGHVRNRAGASFDLAILSLNLSAAPVPGELE